MNGTTVPFQAVSDEWYVAVIKSGAPGEIRCEVEMGEYPNNVYREFSPEELEEFGLALYQAAEAMRAEK